MLARAKVNLTLEVLGKRPDGYHAIRSFVVPISLCDEITFMSAPDVTLVTHYNKDIDATHLGPPTDNLAYRAALLLQRLTGCKAGVTLTLTKRIPIGAGLGGGSADAAATLVGLNDFWQLGLSRADLVRAGAALGSDVPALVMGGCVWMEGRGEKVSPAFVGEEIPPLDLVLVFPGVYTSTKKVYSSYIPLLTKGGQMRDNIHPALLRGNPSVVAQALRNDLMATAEALHPEIARARVALLEHGALGALMSGSGSCVFGVTRDAAHARRLVDDLARFGLRAQAVRTCPVM